MGVAEWLWMGRPQKCPLVVVVAVIVVSGGGGGGGERGPHMSSIN